MVLHGLNPLLQFKCKLTTSVPQIIERIKKYISKGGNIENIIGHKNELKIAPEAELLQDENFKKSEQSNPIESEEDKKVIVWTENSSKGLILEDIYILLKNSEPIFLYYYWDEIPPLELGSQGYCYYHTQKTKDEILGRKEYEDFIEMVANVVQNVLTKKKKQRGRGKRKKPENTTEKPEEKKLENAQKPKENIEENKIPIKQDKKPNLLSLEPDKKASSKAENSLEMQIDMEKPFKSIFDRAKQNGSNSETIKHNPNNENSEKIKTDSLIGTPKSQHEKLKKKKIIPNYEASQQNASHQASSLILVSDNEKQNKGLAPMGSAANSMRIQNAHSNGILSSSAPIFDLSDIIPNNEPNSISFAFDLNEQNNMHAENIQPKANSHMIGQAAPVKKEQNPQKITPSKNSSKKPHPIKSSPNSITPTPTKNAAQQIPEQEKQEESEKLPHPNEAFKISQRKGKNGKPDFII